MRRLTLIALLAAACGEGSPPPAPLLQVEFSPSRPVIHLGTTRDVEGTVVYDHSEFSVRITNGHSEPIRVQRVTFTSVGDEERSGLGNLVSYWEWADETRTLAPGESNEFWKIWGFTVDTPNRTMTYEFEFRYLVGDGTEPVVMTTELVLTPGE